MTFRQYMYEAPFNQPKVGLAYTEESVAAQKDRVRGIGSISQSEFFSFVRKYGKKHRGNAATVFITQAPPQVT